MGGASIVRCNRKCTHYKSIEIRIASNEKYERSQKELRFYVAAETHN